MYSLRNLLKILFGFAFWLIAGPSVFAQTSSATLPNGFPQDGLGPTFDAMGSYLTLTDSLQLANYRKLSPTARFVVTDNGAKGTYQLELATVPIGYGGTNATTAQGALNNIAGTSASGDMLYYNGTNWVHLAKSTDGKVLALSGGFPAWSSTGSAVNANAEFILNSSDGTMANAGVFANGTGITHSFTPGGNCTVSVDTSVVAITSNSLTMTNKTLTSPSFSWNSGSGITLKGSSNDNVLKWADWGASAGNITIPSVNGTTAANILLDQGNQTVAGVKTFSSAPKLSTNTLTSSTGNTITIPNTTDTLVNLTDTQTLSAKTLTNAAFNGGYLTLNQTTANYQVNFNNPGTAGTRNYYVVDVATNADFAMFNHNQAYTAGGIVYADGSVGRVTSQGATYDLLTSAGSGTPVWHNLTDVITLSGTSISGDFSNKFYRAMEWNASSAVSSTMKGAGAADMATNFAVGNGGIEYANTVDSSKSPMRGIEIKTATTVNDAAYFYGGNGETSTKLQPSVKGWAYLTSVAKDNNSNFLWGLSNNPAQTMVSYNNAAYKCAYILLRHGTDTNFQIAYWSGSGSFTLTDSGVAPTYDSANDFELSIDTSGVIHSKINGTTISNVTTPGYGSSSTLSPFVGILNLNNTSDRAVLGVGCIKLTTY